MNYRKLPVFVIRSKIISGESSPVIFLQKVFANAIQISQKLFCPNTFSIRLAGSLFEEIKLNHTVSGKIAKQVFSDWVLVLPILSKNIADKGLTLIDDQAIIGDVSELEIANPDGRAEPPIVKQLLREKFDEL